MSEISGHDLFGKPFTISERGRGRPAHRWTQENENRVLLGCAMGWTNERIASGIGVSVPTLKRYYLSALKRKAIQRDRYELWKMQKLAELGEAGKVAALKEMDRLFLQADRAKRQAELDALGSEPVGKKAREKAAAAETQENGWDGLLNPGGPVQ